MNNPYLMQWLDQQIAFDPAADFAGFLEQVPAKRVVYLLSDEQGRPFQLLSVKNLRASLGNRLCEHPADEKTRSIPYRQVVRQVSYRRVDCSLEAEWVYCQLARELFPDAYRKMLASWEPWYIAIDPNARFPRWIVTDSPEWPLRSSTFGPIATKAAAQKLIETIEDAFDLCRYYSILTQAPRGQACAYKQMHKCPAPCDGSISMDMYHQQIDAALAALRNSDPGAEHEPRMRQAAGALQFELAGKIKAYIEQLRSLRAAGTSVDHLRFCALCRGSKAKAFRLMFLTPQSIQISPEWSTENQLAPILGGFAPQWDQDQPWDSDALSRLTFIARHFMLANPDSILLPTPDAATILAATTRLSRRKQETEPADEGVVQEAQ